MRNWAWLLWLRRRFFPRQPIERQIAQLGLERVMSRKPRMTTADWDCLTMEELWVASPYFGLAQDIYVQRLRAAIKSAKTTDTLEWLYDRYFRFGLGMNLAAAVIERSYELATRAKHLEWLLDEVNYNARVEVSWKMLELAKQTNDDEGLRLVSDRGRGEARTIAAAALK